MKWRTMSHLVKKWFVQKGCRLASLQLKYARLLVIKVPFPSWNHQSRDGWNGLLENFSFLWIVALQDCFMHAHQVQPGIPYAKILEHLVIEGLLLRRRYNMGDGWDQETVFPFHHGAGLAGECSRLIHDAFQRT